jgi:hypothetical protein
MFKGKAELVGPEKNTPVATPRLARAMARRR